MGKSAYDDHYKGYTDILNNLDPKKSLRYGCYDLTICRRCLKLYGWLVRTYTDSVTEDKKSEWHYQKCKCMEADDSKNSKTEPKWNGFDYNTAVEFCYCCSRELINSGSKYSLFYCTDCNERVKGHNNKLGYALIPLGRHSFMNNLMLRVPYTEEQYTRFNNNLTCFFDKVDKVREWQKLCLFENLIDLGSDFKKDIDLPLYDELLWKLKISKEESFRGMLKEFDEIK
jgi:hypothetical protein